MSSKLPTRALGRNGPQVSKLGFGAMGFSSFYNSKNADTEAFYKILDRAADLGCTFWDTSDAYGNNEDVLGTWLARSGRRDEIFLATKFAIYTDEDGTRKIRGDPEHVRAACERSLKRLGVSHIDLYYQHRADQNIPIEITVRAMAELVKEGKVRYLGLSECSAATLRRAHAVHPISAVQVEYSPFTLDIEKVGVLDTCRELGVAVVAYSPLGRGLLTGKIRTREDLSEHDYRLRAAPRFSEENFPKNLVLVDRLGQIAKRKGVTIGQLTLAWIMAQDELIIPIPGTTKVPYLEENVGSLNVELSHEEEAELRRDVDAAEVSGDRYPVDNMPFLLADTPELKH